MSLQNSVIQHFSDSIQIQQDAQSSLSELIVFAAQKIVESLINDNKILSCGNVGSETNVQCFSAEMLHRYERERPALPVIALTTGTSTLNSTTNDGYFDEVFAKQLHALGQAGDILLIYTTNGNSANIIAAVKTAHDKEITVIALTGQDGGALAPFINELDIEIRVPSHSATRIQEVHLLITHCLCDLIDRQLFGD